MRQQGFCWLSTRSGNIRLTKGASGEQRFRAVSRIEEGDNLKSGTIVIDESERFSKYTVKASSPGSDDYPGLVSSSAEGVSYDRGITRNRPLILIAEGNADSALAKRRAQWEASSRLARAVKIDIVTQNWLQEDEKTL